jgi:midasin
MAIRCYALQSRMGESEKEKLQREIIGEKFEVDCDMEFGAEVDGSGGMVDGWIMPITEVERITNARNEMTREAQDFYGAEEGDDLRPIHPSELR